MSKKYQIHIEKDENGVFVGEVIGLPACYTQANNIPDLLQRISEVAEGSSEIIESINTNNKRLHFSLNIDYASA